MKKRFLSGFLAVVMCLGMLPGAAWAEEGGIVSSDVSTAGSGTGSNTGSGTGSNTGSGSNTASLISAVNISGGGGPECSNYAVSAVYKSREGSGKNTGLPERFMGAGYTLVRGDDAYTPFYFEDVGKPTNHEIILYSTTELDPQMLHLTTGTLVDGFTRGVCGDGEGTLYYYKGTIEVPAEGGYIIIFYQQNSVVRLDTRRITGFDGATTCLFTNIYPKSYTVSNDIISSFTVEVAGLGLPITVDSYAIEGWTLEDISGCLDVSCDH